jgi:hypothetical protein
VLDTSGAFQTDGTVWKAPLGIDLVGRFTQRLGTKRWDRTTSFDENRARKCKDHGPQNLATLRKLALNFLQIGRPYLLIRRKRSGRSGDIARSILGQVREQVR